MTAMKIIMSIINSDPPTLRNSSKFSKDFQNFIHACLQKDPKKRPSAEDLLKHKFIQKAQDESYLEDNFLVDVGNLEDRIGEDIRIMGEGKQIHWIIPFIQFSSLYRIPWCQREKEEKAEKEENQEIEEGKKASLREWINPIFYLMCSVLLF